jgi:hypothetical protein
MRLYRHLVVKSQFEALELAWINRCTVEQAGGETAEVWIFVLPGWVWMKYGNLGREWGWYRRVWAINLRTGQAWESFSPENNSGTFT